MKAKHGGLHHIEIYVSNLEQTRHFYEWFLGLLGYREFQSWDQGFSFLHGSTYVVFVQTAEKYLKQSYHRCGTGLNHFAFWANSIDQVDQVRELLRARGVNILYQDRHPHAGGPDHYAVFFEDPDRIKLELVAPD
ncbi:MAG: VOC family protein [Candidatus Marinimicrobia bacterium]|nr:VOC family protein [Candidatus Neomarinimicrobiota bacterium]MCF7922373.1 VOC family protein [Candidatus Neomarinimicrobiota bacterium]